MLELAESKFSNLCRLCGEVDGVCLDLFEDLDQGEELLFKIENSIRISIQQNDGLPQSICTECHSKLLDCFSFYKQCHDTQERLKEFLCIESAIQNTNSSKEFVNENEVMIDTYDQSVESGPEDYFDEVQGENEETVEQNMEQENEVNIQYQLDTEASFNEDGDELMTFTSNPVFPVKEEQEMSETLIFDPVDATEVDENSELTSKTTGKKLVYFVKNASHMSVESVLSAVLGSSGCSSPGHNMSLLEPPPLIPFKKMTSLLDAKKRSPDPTSQKVVIEGSDGKEMMVLLDLPGSVTKEIVSVESFDDVDDPTWSPGNVGRERVRPNPQISHRWSKLKRARNAVRNSVKTLRLPKPQRKREVKENSSGRKMPPISKDDPNYAIMMEKFAKPVSLSTLKRHGLYQPKPNSYKMKNAPYKKDVAPYIEKMSDTEFRCKICLSAKFRWNYKAEIHILEHLDRRPFECDVCGRSFTQNQYLRKHKRLHFPDESKFICEVCGKGFQRRYYLTYHMDEHFDYSYTCEDCGRKFSRRQKLDEHVRYHHKCNYSVCDICGQTLRTTALSRHRKHHLEKGQPRKRSVKGVDSSSAQSSWASCEICGRAFRSISARDQHHEEHRNAQHPFHCEVCAIYFKTRRSLNDHTVLVHSNIVDDESQAATRVLDILSGD